MEVLHSTLKDPQSLAKSLVAKREANLLLLKKEFPQFYEFFTKEKGSYEVGLQISPEGSINLVVNGNLVYHEDPLEVCKRQFERFVSSPYSIRQAYTKEGLEDFRDYIIDHRYAKAIYDISPIRQKEVVGEEYFFDKSLPTLIVFGVGLGYHLEMLVDYYDIKQLIIVEADPEIVKTSLYTIDWVKILRKFTSEGRLLTIITGKDSKEISKKILDYARSFMNQALFFNVFVYIHADNPKIHEVISTLHQKFSLFSSGWGFFNDELWSLEQTIENIRMAIPVLTSKTISQNYPIFIIGSGPSLDDLIPYIEREKNRAIIVSCGSAVSTLQKYGILPDFHVEIERTKTTYDYLVEALEEDYLNNLRIIANNPMHPSVFTLGKEQYMFVKPNDTGALLFDPSLPRMYYANPTVVNGGLSVFLHMGFREIYLFGADMGFKNPEKHHSSGHLSLKKGSRFYQPKEGYNMEVEANFGGKVFTNRILFGAKDAIENLVELFPKSKVYNLSDGARIEGTIPLRANRLKLYSKRDDKMNVIQEICSLFSDEPLKKINIGKFLKELRENFKVFVRQAEDLLREVKDKDEALTAFQKLFLNLSRNEVLNTMLRGGFLINESVFLLSLFATENDEDAENFITNAKEIFINYLRECATALENLS